MATVKHEIRENDVVELRDAVGQWPAGTRGTAVSDYGDVKLVEISNERGRTLDLIQARESGLSLVGKRGE